MLLARLLVSSKKSHVRDSIRHAQHASSAVEAPVTRPTQAKLSVSATFSAAAFFILGVCTRAVKQAAPNYTLQQCNLAG